MNKAGFTIVEVMVAVAVLGLLVAGLAPAFVTQLRVNTLTEIRTEAAAAAQKKLDDLRLQDPATFPPTGTFGPEDIIVGGRTYQVVTTYCLLDSLCNTTTRHIQVEVIHRGKSRYTVDTVYAQLR